MNNIPISFPILGEDAVINPSTHITVFGRNIYWYGILIAVGFILAVLYGLKRSRDLGLTPDNILDCLIVATPVGIIGARLYYVVFNPSEYFGPGKWGNIVKIWEGGLAIYGGILFTILAIIIVCRVKKICVWNVLDVASLGFPIGQCIGRWGNFFNREAYGSVTDVFCRMGLHFPSGTEYVHPTFLYESVWNLAGFILLHIVSRKHRRFSGQIFVMYLGWYGLGRFFIEGLRTDSLYLGSTDIRVSQLLAGVCFCGAVVVMLYCLRTNKKIIGPAAADTPVPAEGPAAAEEMTAEDAPAEEAAEAAEDFSAETSGGIPEEPSETPEEGNVSGEEPEPEKEEDHE